MDILPGVIFYKDEDGRYIYANKECRDFNKLRGIDNIIGKTDIEINPNKKLVEKFLHDDAIISGTKTSIFNEVIFENPDGTKNYREVVKMPLIDGIGNILGIVGRSIDITEKVIAQERLKYLSYTDILTEVNNKTSFEERAEELSKESYLPLGLIMGDTNGFNRIIRASSELQNVAQGVLHHHERGDGKGYPMGLKGEEIPIISRIVSVSDAYDVVTNDRIYKKAVNSEESIEEIKRCSGTQFDPRVVEAFLEFLKRL